MHAKSFSYRSNVTSREGDRIIWPPVKPPYDKYHRGKHHEPNIKTDSGTKMSIKFILFIKACLFFYICVRHWQSTINSNEKTMARYYKCKINLLKQTVQDIHNITHLNFTLQTCLSISRYNQATHNTEKDEKSMTKTLSRLMTKTWQRWFLIYQGLLKMSGAVTSRRCA